MSIGKIQNLKGVITMVKWVNELSSIYKEVEPKYFYRQIFQHHLDEPKYVRKFHRILAYSFKKNFNKLKVLTQ